MDSSLCRVAFWQAAPILSHALDNAHAHAVNPVTNDVYYGLLSDIREETEDDSEIPDELVYATDETGIQGGIGSKERVIGPKGQHIQHQQQSGTWENITVIVTICADGTSIPPAIIFKGEGFQVAWKQNNPLMHRKWPYLIFKK